MEKYNEIQLMKNKMDKQSKKKIIHPPRQHSYRVISQCWNTNTT